MPCKCWCCIRIYPCSLPLTLNQLCGSPCCSCGSNDHRSADGHQIHLSSPHPTGSLIRSHPAQRLARANFTHLFPTLYSATTHGLLEIGLRGSIYTVAFNQCYQSGLCQEPVDKHLSVHHCSSRCSAFCAAATLSSLLFLVHIRNASVSGPLYRLLCLPRILFAQISYGSSLCSNVTFSMRPSLNTPFKIATLPPFLKLLIPTSRSNVNSTEMWNFVPYSRI